MLDNSSNESLYMNRELRDKIDSIILTQNNTIQKLNNDIKQLEDSITGLKDEIKRLMQLKLDSD